MFLQNKYNKLYHKIIENSKSTTREKSEGYFEYHHIIPKSMGGTDDSTNLAKLTAREHFIAHRILTKITSDENQQKAWIALWAMVGPIDGTRRDYKLSSRTYAHIRYNVAIAKTKDRIGIKYGLLTVKAYHGINGKGCHTWKCKCDCGKIIIRQRLDKAKSCGCLRSLSLVKNRTKAMTTKLNHEWSPDLSNRKKEAIIKWATLKRDEKEIPSTIDGFTLNELNIHKGNMCRGESDFRNLIYAIYPKWKAKVAKGSINTMFTTLVLDPTSKRPRKCDVYYKQYLKLRSTNKSFYELILKHKPNWLTDYRSYKD